MNLKIGLPRSYFMCINKYEFFLHFPCTLSSFHSFFQCVLRMGKKLKLLLFMKALETCKNAINPNGFPNYISLALHTSIHITHGTHICIYFKSFIVCFSFRETVDKRSL